MPVRPVFQLAARGDSRNGWRFRANSKKIFLDRQAAEAYIPEFHKVCIDPTPLESADPEGLKIEVLELELQE
jgi:hypothetical protein